MSGVLLMAAIGSGPRIQLQGATASDVDASLASAGYTLESDGDELKSEGASTDDLGDWITPKGLAPGAYECRMTYSSGDTPAGPALGSWHALTSSRSWSLTQSGTGSKDFSGTIEIRTGGGLIVASAAVSLSAEVT